MSQITKQNEKVVLDRDRLEILEKKASFLEELLSLIEDKYLGSLMEKTEEEENIPFSKAEEILK